MDKLLMIEAMKLLQRKYGIIHEISRITKDMGESVSRDDRVSIQMLINMRQEEMEKADRCDQSIYDLEQTLPFGERLEFVNLIKNGDAGGKTDTFESKKIKELHGNIQSLLKKTIEMDQAINRRISGEKSFYSNTEPGA